MSWRLAGVILVCALCLPAYAQHASGSGQLQVSVTVVSSTYLIPLGDGSYRMVVANAPSRGDMIAMQLAVNRPQANANVFVSQDTITVTMAPTKKGKKISRKL